MRIPRCENELDRMGFSKIGDSMVTGDFHLGSTWISIFGSEAGR